MNWKFWKHTPPQIPCEHTFTKWEVTNKYENERKGIIKIVQSRSCTVCGFTQINAQQAGA